MARRLAQAGCAVCFAVLGVAFAPHASSRGLRRTLRAASALVHAHACALFSELADLATHPQRVRRVHIASGELAAEEFELRVSSQATPAVITGLDLGCASAPGWSPDFLRDACPDKRVAVHVCARARMRWVGEKNFGFETMPFAELVRRVWLPSPPLGRHQGPFYYLRSVGEKMRTQRADLDASFPELARAVRLPRPFSPEAFFSSALRVSSAGLALWTHNDVMENLLVHVLGTKRVTLWPPSAAPSLGVVGSSSRCGGEAAHDESGSDDDGGGDGGDDDDANGGGDNGRAAREAAAARRRARRARRARARAASLVTRLRPGEVLYIPPLWFHHVTSETAAASVNVFWRGLQPEAYARKDLYGNRDLAVAEKALADAAAAAAALRDARFPEPYASYYRERLGAHVAAASLASSPVTQ